MTRRKGAGDSDKRAGKNEDTPNYRSDLGIDDGSERDRRCLGGIHRLSWIAVAFPSYDFIPIEPGPSLCGNDGGREGPRRGAADAAFQIRSDESGKHRTWA